MNLKNVSKNKSVSQRIRKASPEDAERVHELILSGSWRGKVLKRSVTDVRRSIRSFIVAEVSGKPVACCSLDIYNKKLAEIRSLVVDSGWEGRKIATALIQRCLKEARSKGVYEVLVITDQDRLFRHHGFREELHGQKALFYRSH